MAIQKGNLLLLRIGDGQASETFTTIGGIRATNMRLNNNIVDASNVASGAWRKLLDNSGISSLSVEGKGFFADSTAEETMRGYAFSNIIKNYELLFANGDKISGAFQIASYERDGDYDNVEGYSMTLESSGDITFSVGS